jgi:hypothetical protein
LAKKYSYHQTFSESLFDLNEQYASDLQHYRHKLAEAMRSNQIPVPGLRFEALKEQFLEIQTKQKNPDDRQPLFQNTFETVEISFPDLAQSFYLLIILLEAN